jgi:nucleolar protein 15
MTSTKKAVPKRPAPMEGDSLTEVKKSVISIEVGGEEKAIAKAKKAAPYSERRAIVYISHLPYGFFEKELREYLGQFGPVTNLRIGRSKKTGGSKGYAFVEFKYPEVAKIVSETMNNYLMFDKLVKCEVVAPEKMHKKIFVGKVNPDHPPASKARRAAKKEVNKLRDEEQENKRLRKQLKKLEAIRDKLEAAGIKTGIDFSHLKSSLPPTGKTPVMEVDEDELDITLKTPPHVKKVMSRNNSNANSAVGTPTSSRNATPGGTMPLAKMSTARELMMSKVLQKLGETPSAMGKKTTPQKVGSKRTSPSMVTETPKSAKKARKESDTPTAASTNTPKKAKTPKADITTTSKAIDTPKSAKKARKDAATPKAASVNTPKKAKTPKADILTPSKDNEMPKSAKKARMEFATPKSSKKAQKESATPKAASLDTPKKANTPKAASPKSPKKAKTPKAAIATPKQKPTSPKAAADNTPKKAKTPKAASIKTPKKAKTPKTAIATPKAASPNTPKKVKTPKATSPNTPKKAKTPKTVSATPKAASPNTPKKSKTPKAASLKTPKEAKTPKTTIATPKQKPTSSNAASTNTPKKAKTPKAAIRTPKQKPTTPNGSQSAKVKTPTSKEKKRKLKSPK